MRQRLDETEDLIARTEEDYLRALLSGADLPPLSAIHAAAEALRMDGPEGWPRVSRGGRTLKPASDVTPSGCA